MRPGYRSLAAFAISFCAASLSAGTVSKLNDDVFGQLREAGVRRKIVIEGVPLYDSSRSRIELEEFEVWAPGAKIIIHGASGVQRLDPPARRFYRGLVNSDPESLAFFAVDPATNAVRGMIVTRDKRYVVGSVRSRATRSGPQKIDDFLTAIEPEDEIPEYDAGWRCDVDKMQPGTNGMPIHASGIGGVPVTAGVLTGTQQYEITVEVETDFELFQNAGNNSTTVTNYVTSLTGAVSTVYKRDLNTNVKQGNVHVYTAVGDPWTQSNPDPALDELAQRYTVTTPRTTSAVVMLSGKDVPAGVAWEGLICASTPGGSPRFPGPFAWCGAIGKAFGVTKIGTVPGAAPGDTTLTVPPYAMPDFDCPPSGTCSNQNFWPLAEYTHELGHVMAGHHTHCVAITAAEQAATGRSFVDTCYNAEGVAGCVSGVPAGKTCDANGFCSPAVPEKGTIMSYCHNIFGGPSNITPQSRYTFGQLTDPSHNELDSYMLRAAGPLNSLQSPRNIVNGTNFGMSAISSSPSVTSGSTGNSASITPIAGVTYTWSITNGTITAGQGTSAITFTAGGVGTVTVGVLARSTSTQCGISDTKGIPCLAGGTFNPPTGVVASFNNFNTVVISWTAPASGTAPVQYDIYRSAANNFATFPTMFAPLAASGTMFLDTSVSPNSSYVYKIRSAGAGGTNESADSNRDIVTTVVVTVPSLASGISNVRAADVNEIRSMANAIHVLAGLGPVTFTNTTITGGTSKINAADITDVRTAINQALPAMGFPAFTFSTDPSITVNTTMPRLQHITDARAAVQ